MLTIYKNEEPIVYQLLNSAVENEKCSHAYLFEIKNNKGIRKKVMPQLDGTFLTNDTFETIEIKDANGKFFIHYRTALAKWQEEIISLNDQELVLLNSEKKEYHYKKTAPINLTGNGKKTQ